MRERTGGTGGSVRGDGGEYEREQGGQEGV